MKRWWLWLAAIVLLLLVAGRQAATIGQLRIASDAYDAKVKNAFRYTARHMDLTTLYDALEALATTPSPSTLQRAEQAAEAYNDMLLQLTDLRESGPPVIHGGFQTGTYAYYPSTQAQADLLMQVERARLKPALHGMGVILQRDGWQLRAEDKQFLSDMTGLVRELNTKLDAADKFLRQQPAQPSALEYAQQQLADIGPQVDSIANRVKAFQATLSGQ